jgi:hypothetical protein
MLAKPLYCLLRTRMISQRMTVSQDGPRRAEPMGSVLSNNAQPAYPAIRVIPGAAGMEQDLCDESSGVQMVRNRRSSRAE